MSESIEDKRKRLSFRSWHRGTREIDIILGKFSDQYIAELDEELLTQYDVFLQNPDPDIFNWVSGKEPIPEEHQSKVTEMLLEFFKTVS